MTKKYLSFFSGALGLDTGLDMAGLEPLMFNEYDKKIAETIKFNQPDKKLYNCDINLLSKDKIFNDLNLNKNEKIFLMAGGPPCQPFSTNGKRLSLLDARGNSLLKYLKLIMEIQPEYFILENVRGILSAELIKENGEKDKKGTVLKYILDQFKDSGYDLNFNLYDTSYYGVPQKRERFVLFGSFKKGIIPHITPTTKENPKTFSDAMQDFNGTHEYSEYSKRYKEIYRMIPEGGNWKDLSIENQKKYMGGSYNSGGGKTGFFRRLSLTKPAPTLLTSPSMKSTGLCHPTENRPLSIEEYSRLQTFPDSLKVQGSTATKYKQLGNAVPCLFGKVIGEHILKFDKNKKMKDYKGSTSRYKNTTMEDWLDTNF